MNYCRILTLIFCFFYYSAHSQVEPKEGIYLSFAQLKKNKPLELDQISVPNNVSKSQFLLSASPGDSFVCFDSFGLQQQIPVDSIWGMFINKVFYIKKGNEFSQIQIFGVLSFFTARILVENLVNDYNPYNPYSTSSTRIQYSYENRNYIINFNNGDITEYNLQNFETAISDDKDLHQEFQTLKFNKKKEMMFYYMRRYNKNHHIKFEE